MVWCGPQVLCCPQVHSLKAKHASELTALGRRAQQTVQNIVSRKDVTITALRAELAALTARLKEYEALLA